MYCILYKGREIYLITFGISVTESKENIIPYTRWIEWLPANSKFNLFLLLLIESRKSMASKPTKRRKVDAFSSVFKKKDNLLKNRKKEEKDA